MYGNPAPFSYQPRGFPQEDPPSQRPSLSRPNGKSIYMQRKEYAESMNKQPDNFHYRVEHLFTCDVDGQDVRNLNDCVARLKRLDAKSKLWGQDMILEAQEGYLLLIDIETKAELESLPLGCILEIHAVLDSCAYNSLLTVTVQQRNRGVQVFMFQCEEVGAEHIRADLDRAIRHKGADIAPRREQNDIRTSLGNIIGQHAAGGSRKPEALPPPMMPPERLLPPPDHPAPQWNDSGSVPPPSMYIQRQDEPVYRGDSQYAPEEPQYSDTERSVEILNHVLSDVELFLGQVAAAAANDGKIKKKKGSKKKDSKKKGGNLPSVQEMVSCLQKIKYGFNLLAKLDGELSSPSAPDFVHILFSGLGMVVSHYPPDIPPTILTPLLTKKAIELLNQEVSPEEEQLWRSLGDYWNFHRSQWPDGDMIPPYIPEFSDGWLLPPPVASPFESQPISRSNSQHHPPHSQDRPISRSNSQHVRGDLMQKPEPMMNHPWDPPPPTRHSETPLFMRVIYDFMARNSQELSVMKGDVVQVVDKSKQWWRVRNIREEEGHVPQNVLEPLDGREPWQESQDMLLPPPLNMMSSPADVTAWLEFKGFSKLTVRSLGVLNGKLLLGMTRDEMRTVCPEEGGRVFFQLQGIRSAIALASETGHGPYNGR